MSVLLFNINDLALILAIAACLFHIGLLGLQNTVTQKNIFLSLFLLCIALTFLDALIYWSLAIKSQLLLLSPHIFFIFKVSLFLQAPLLFFYVKSVLFFNLTLTPNSALHFLPGIFFIIAIPLIYHSLGEQNLEAGIHNYSILFADPIFRFFMWLSKLSYIVYGFLCLRMLQAHSQKLKDNISSIDKVNADWLRLLVIGFVFLWLWDTLAQALTQVNLSGHILSLLKNYAHLALVVTLLFLNISRASYTLKHNALEVETTFATQLYTTEHVQRINEAMNHRQVYLDPELSLNKLSKVTSLPKRLLSAIINKHYERNFFEFVNYYRVEHAKDVLAKDGAGVSMIDVMNRSGFNSKSAFNRFFKKFTGMTPTQYRAYCASQKLIKSIS
ncbi:AraC family transcriptional regulator [Agarilytica rhodophyticola]|uniref:AraC family transcriptional regulator n=1 Tax=Agarilytica rhodophyticola TaxID=1737490 RepID=UPI000B341D00|nr:helix-turn-helix domain-containing protein [Agarilytica rhodophyticola]